MAPVCVGAAEDVADVVDVSIVPVVVLVVVLLGDVSFTPIHTARISFPVRLA
jgi:hypothetical protein